MGQGNENIHVGTNPELKCVKIVDYGREFKTIRTNFGRLLTTLGGAELADVNFPHKIRRVVSGDGAILLLTYEQQAFLYANENFAKIELENVNFIAMNNTVAVLATTKTVYTYENSELTEVRVEGEFDSDIKQIEAGPRILCAILASGKLYCTDPQSNLLQYGLFNKPVAMVSVGSHHSVALVRRELPKMKLWNTEIVLKWFTDNGFADCVDILQNTRVTGQFLLKADKKLMYETWGIQEEDRRRKLLWLIQQSTNGVIEEQGILHGWGANRRNGLGPGNKLVKKPKPLPKLNLESDEHIQKISCGNYRTLVLTT